MAYIKQILFLIRAFIKCLKREHQSTVASSQHGTNLKATDEHVIDGTQSQNLGNVLPYQHPLPI